MANGGSAETASTSTALLAVEFKTALGILPGMVPSFFWMTQDE